MVSEYIVHFMEWNVPNYIFKLDIDLPDIEQTSNTKLDIHA